jgi:hypothetical protein
MKKVFFGTLAIAILAISSCSKTSSNAGTWTIKGTSYTAATCLGAADILSASNGSTSSLAGLSITFNGTSLPTAGGTDSVVSLIPTSAGQITIAGTIGTTSYTSVGGGTATVTVSGGKVSVSGTNIKVANGTDTTTATFNITQQ